MGVHARLSWSASVGNWQFFYIAIFGVMSAIDAVDGSSTGTRVPWIWEPLKLPRFGGATRANCYDNRFRHRKISISGAWHRWCRPGGDPPSVEAPVCAGFLSEAAIMSGRHRSLRLITLLVARAPSTWSQRAIDAASLCEALRQAAEERYGGC